MRAAIVAAVLGSVSVLAAPAHADKADRLARKAKRLLADKKYARACKTFEQVDELEPGLGAKLDAARCYEQWGRIATAYRWYRDAEALAKQTGDDRLAKIEESLAELDFNVPRLTVHVPEGADPTVVATLTLDGKPFDRALLGAAQFVDPGSHVLEFVVDGDKKRKMVPVERGGESEVTLDIPQGTGDKPGDPKGSDGGAVPGVPSAPERPGRTQRIVGVSLAAAGGVALGVAAGITLHARGTYNDALDAHCMGSTQMCDDRGLELTRDARGRANTATVISIAGGAAILGGVLLYLLAPDAASREEHALYLTPIGYEGGGAIVFGGRY